MSVYKDIIFEVELGSWIFTKELWFQYLCTNLSLKECLLEMNQGNVSYAIV